MDWSLPSGERFVGELVSALARGHHLAVILPALLERHPLVAALTKRNRLEGLGETTVLSIDKALAPLEAVNRALGTHAVNVAELVACEPPSRLLAVALDGTDPDPWKTFLLELASQTQVQAGSSFQLCALADATFSRLRGDLLLSVEAWWGRLTELDIESVVARRLELSSPASIAERYWIRALCRGLAVSDAEAAQLLIERCPRTLDEILETFADLGESPSIELPRTPVNRIDRRFVRPPAPNEGAERDLWSAGLLDWHEGYGTVIKSRALAAAQRDALLRRLWRGQVEILLPLVEIVRSDICDWFAERYGTGWAIDLCQRTGLSDPDAVESEIGQLAQLIGRLPNRSIFVPPPLRQTVFKWRQLRNQLAHTRPIDFALLDDCLRAHQSLAQLQ